MPSQDLQPAIIMSRASTGSRVHQAHGAAFGGPPHPVEFHVSGTLQAVEFTKLMALLSAILTILSLAAYIALTLAWGLREIDCNRACADLPA